MTDLIESNDSKEAVAQFEKDVLMFSQTMHGASRVDAIVFMIESEDNEDYLQNLDVYEFEKGLPDGYLTRQPYTQELKDRLLDEIEGFAYDAESDQGQAFSLVKHLADDFERQSEEEYVISKKRSCSAYEY